MYGDWWVFLVSLFSPRNGESWTFLFATAPVYGGVWVTYIDFSCYCDSFHFNDRCGYFRVQ